MITASLTHRTAYLRFNEADTEEKRMKLAYQYFLYDAPVVDKELQKELKKEMELGTNGRSDQTNRSREAAD